MATACEETQLCAVEGRPLTPALRKHAESCSQCRFAVSLTGAMGTAKTEALATGRLASPRTVQSAGATGSVQPGTVLAQKYRVERLLGSGGMGVIVAAHHLQLDAKVAIKFLLPETLRLPSLVARFEREARAAVKITSEHVARVIDVGRLPGGAPYMVMEYLEGGDLSAWIKERGPMPVEQAAEFVLQACEAIAEAHALGIVHRDLKPANLFCIRRADGLLSVKVLDFGISKVFDRAGSLPDGLTATNDVLGSPLYMSPEQILASRDVDARTDLWSLGVILFELVTGRLPFEATQVTEAAVKIATEQPLALRAVWPQAPPALEQVVMRCLEKNRERRFQTIGDLAVALRPFAPSRAMSSVERILRTVDAGRTEPLKPMGDPAAAAAAPGMTGKVWWRPVVAATRRQRVGVVAAGAIALGATVAFVARWGSHPTEPRSAPAAPAALAPASALPSAPLPSAKPRAAPSASSGAAASAASATAAPPPSATPSHTRQHTGMPSGTPPPAAPVDLDHRE